MEHWFTERACDGFNVMPAWMPGSRDDFVTLVTPELQRRNLFRTAYTGKTLRHHLGLNKPQAARALPQVAESPRCSWAMRVGRLPPRFRHLRWIRPPRVLRK